MVKRLSWLSLVPYYIGIKKREGRRQVGDEAGADETDELRWQRKLLFSCGIFLLFLTVCVRGNKGGVEQVRLERRS